MKTLTNTELEMVLRDEFPQYRENTSKLTAENFTEKGYTALKQANPQRLNDFFSMTLRLFLERIDVAKVKDNLELYGFGDEVLNPYGGYIQRMTVEMIRNSSPSYMNLKDGDSPDPFVVRKPKTKERFFEVNAEFQSFVTIPDDVMFKNMFISETGMFEFASGIKQQLENAYIKFLYFNKLEAINAGINSEEWELKETQKYTVAYSEKPTTEELADFILTIKNVISLMDASPSTGAFNAMGFESAQDISRLKLLVRVGFKNELSVRLLSGTFNPDQLTLPIDVIEVNNFGGLQPFKDAEYTAPLFEVFDKVGSVIGYAETEDATEPTVSFDDVVWKDPNENVIALIADKDLVFTARQGGYSVEPIRNPRGLYTNYWASAPRGTVAYDSLYNVVVLTKEPTKAKKS